MPRTRKEIEGAIWSEGENWAITTRMRCDHDALILEILLDIRDSLQPLQPQADRTHEITLRDALASGHPKRKWRSPSCPTLGCVGVRNHGGACANEECELL